MIPKIISFLLYLGDFFDSFDYSEDGGVIFGRIIIPTYFLINLSINDDSGYQYWGVEQSNNDLIIGFTANKKGPSKDPYSRVVFLHYESLSNKLLSFCLNKNISSILFRNKSVFFGKYSNHATNDTCDSDFKMFVI